MNKYIKLALLFSIVSLTVSAQYRYRGRMYTGNRDSSQQRRSATIKKQASGFKPVFNLSIGYGFPNLDKNAMLEFQNYNPGKANQQGSFILSADYQFSRTTSFGIMASYAKVSRPYYYANDVLPVFTGKLENTALMLNVIRYVPATKVITPYLRTAIGINISHNRYSDANGADFVRDTDDNTFAYQASLGMKLNFTKHAGAFVEAGYGKYIVGGGLAFKL